MHKKIVFFIFLLASFTLHAQHAGFKELKDISSFKEKFAATAKQIKTIKSDFTQEKNLSMLSEKIVSTGKFWFKKENMVRMEYEKPFQYLMVINKNNVTVKDGNKTNSVSAKSNKLFQQISRITVDCVQGTAFDNPDFTLKVFENNSTYMIEMTPIAKAMKEFFNTINIQVSKKDYGVNSIDMIEASGDNTLITFTNKELNTDVADAVFVVH